MAQPSQIIIIGAGVAGLGVGWQLAKAGVQVTVFERDTVGCGASGAAAGMLAPNSEVAFEEDELLRLGLKSLALYPDFVAELEEAAGMSVDYRDEGTLMVALDPDDARKLDHVHAYRQKLGLDARKLDAAQVRALEPGLTPTLHSALHIPSDHQVSPALITRALAEALRRAGGEIIERCAVDEIVVSDAGVRAVITEHGERVDCDQILLAAGAWSKKISGLPPKTLPSVRPVRGQMIAIALGEPAICRHVIRAPDAYLVPKSSGHLLIGSTMEERGFDQLPTAGGIFELLRGAWEALPGIYDQHLLDTWVGFRPISLDNLPVLGKSQVDGLWLAMGHGRNGILLTPASALGLSEAILGAETPEYLRGFTPARFAI